MNNINILLILLFSSIINANYVKEIIIIGNVKTKTSIIYRNIQHPMDAPFNAEIAKIDQENLKKLECFVNVSVENKDSLYQIYVVEKPSISLRPLIDKDNDVGWAGGLKLNFNNVQGKTNRLYTTLLFGDPFYKFNIEYVDRKLGQSKYQMKINYQTKEEESIEKNYNFLNRTLTLKFLKKESNNKLGFYLGYQNNKINVKNNTFPDLQNDIYKYIIYTLTYNNKFIKSKNHILSIEYNHHLSQKSKHNNYSSLSIQSEKTIFLLDHIRPPKLHIKFLGFLKSKDELPYYENEYLGKDKYVRGFDPNPTLNNVNAIDKLKFFNMLIYSIELFIPVNDKINLLNNLNLMFFVDYGIGSNVYNKFDLSNKIKSFGIGCKFNMHRFTKEDFIISIAFNEFGQRQIHFHTNKIIF